jgi:competence protein ComEA
MVVAPININTANVQQLTELSGIGESKAKAIVAYRQQHGDFKSVDDLTQVKGIGEGIIAKIKSRLTVK